MGAVPQKVLNWLYHVLGGEYHDINRTYTDVALTISRYPNFSLKTDVYTYENGQSALLVNLAGTLPGNFRGVTYMFPLSIWVPHGYPRAVPIIFVVPTKRMSVRPGQHVSGEGRIYHPYLAAWREDRSNITDFLSVLEQVFAREPPVIARPDPPPTQQMLRPGMSSAKGQNPPPIPPPIPPLPPELEVPSADTESSQVTTGPGVRPPKLPPKSVPPDGQNITFSNHRLPLAPPLPIVGEQRYRSLPHGFQQPHPKPMLSGPPNPAVAMRNVHTEELGAHSKHPATPVYPRQERRDSHSPVSPLSPEQQLGNQPLASTQASQASHFPRQPLPRQAQFGNPQPSPAIHQWGPSQHPQPFPPSHPHPNPRNQPRHTYQLPRPKANPPGDLLTSPLETLVPEPSSNAAPPPIPPNPEKDALLSALSQTLTQRVRSSHDANMAAILPLRAQQTALHAALTSMNHEISQLNDLQSLLTSNESILRQAMRDADKVMEDAKHRKVPNIDDVLVAPTVVARQLYELVADETSLEECRGVVGRALDRGRIGGDVWAKQTRSLAREEFLRKVLIRKIAQGMNLITDERWE